MSTQNFTVEELIHNKSFRNWVEGIATKNEQQFWDDWVNESDRNRRAAHQAQQEWIGLSLKDSFSIPDKNEAWKKIDYQITEDKTRTGRLRPKKPLPGVPSTPFRSYGMAQFMRYAAILALVFTGSLTWHFLADSPSGDPEIVTAIEEKVTTGYGERKNITLSDGSRIILNANSELTYVVNPAKPGAVEVTLEGEAWFSVTSRRNISREADQGAFRVFTDDGNVSVLGTRFTVATHTQITRVVLEEGEVVVIPYPGEEASGKKVVLKPDELAEYSRFSDDVKIRSVNTQIYTSWKDPKLVFEQTPVREVIDRIEHTYGVQVVVRDSNVTERTISGSVENSGLESIVSVLREVLSISIKMDGDTVYLGEKSEINPIMK